MTMPPAFSIVSVHPILSASALTGRDVKTHSLTFGFTLRVPSFHAICIISQIEQWGHPSVIHDTSFDFSVSRLCSVRSRSRLVNSMTSTGFLFPRACSCVWASGVKPTAWNILDLLSIGFNCDSFICCKLASL